MPHIKSHFSRNGIYPVSSVFVAKAFHESRAQRDSRNPLLINLHSSVHRSSVTDECKVALGRKMLVTGFENAIIFSNICIVMRNTSNIKVRVNCKFQKQCHCDFFCTF